MNQFLTNEFTEVIAKTIQEIVNDPATYLGSKYLPTVSRPERKIRAEIWEATGGLTNEHMVGTNPQYIQRTAFRAEEFEGGFYKEAIHYDERDILFLREVGNNGRNVRGVQEYMARDTDRLNRRLEARMEKLRWDAIFNGSFSHFGRTVSFAIPAANRAVPIGALWSLDSINANAAANPIADIRYWVTGGLAAFRKYKISKLIMNGNTARWILENANTKAYISSIGANPQVNEWSIDKLMQFLIPGGPGVEVYNGWFQSESVVSGKLTVSDATYFIPDGYIFLEVTNLPGGDKIGEFQLGVHLASGTVNDPGYGKFLVVDDQTQPGTSGGPKNPFLDLVGGFYGGPNLMRSFDVLTAKVIA